MAIKRSRRLRRNSTDAERALWALLRHRQLGGHKIRRQHPIGPYVVDFICLSRHLVVEIDGGQHALQARRDAARTAWLESQGFRVIRFWNNQVLGELDEIRVAILNELERPTAPHPKSLSREGRGT